ncbi:unnamed protein product [Linum trigynum]|uniref:Uncharacterized protein n=1 Tax=Linum trigynum TaxID=586398 RepID=A0AAV2GRY0_9ROSI
MAVASIPLGHISLLHFFTCFIAADGDFNALRESDLGFMSLEPQRHESFQIRLSHYWCRWILETLSYEKRISAKEMEKRRVRRKGKRRNRAIDLVRDAESLKEEESDLPRDLVVHTMTKKSVDSQQRRGNRGRRGTKGVEL